MLGILSTRLAVDIQTAAVAQTMIFASCDIYGHDSTSSGIPAKFTGVVLLVGNLTGRPPIVVGQTMKVLPNVTGVSGRNTANPK